MYIYNGVDILDECMFTVSQTDLRIAHRMNNGKNGKQMHFTLEGAEQQLLMELCRGVRG